MTASKTHTGAFLAADIEVKRGAFTLAASLSVDRGTVVAVLGPNGSGKSTLLSAIAGFLSLGRGSIEVGGRCLSREDARTTPIRIPPYQRGVGILTQSADLFPHLTAYENIAFGPRSQGMGRREAAAIAERWMEDVGLPGYGSLRPHELSGGQQQRVALARTLAAKPRLLLLDEPFASLDTETTDDVRELVSTQIASTQSTALIVSHDIVDALSLASRSIVLHEGRIVEEASTFDLVRAPRTAVSARLVGINRLEGTNDTAVFHPADVEILMARPTAHGPDNVWPAYVLGLSRDTRALSVRLELGGEAQGLRVKTSNQKEFSLVPQDSTSPRIVAEIRVEAAAALNIVRGARVWVRIPQQSILAYAAEKW